MAKLLSPRSVNRFLYSIFKDCHLFFSISAIPDWNQNFMNFYDFFVVWCFGCNMKTLMRKMTGKLQFVWDQSLNIMGLSYAVKKSFLEVFCLNRTIMESFTYMFTNSFIHPRNITGNIYHSLYHIIHWKVSLKTFGSEV